VKRIKYVILHHTGAEEKNADQVKSNHLRRGWRDVGYNYIIERNGRVVTGRPPTIPGAHCKAGNMNFKSIGIALIGNLDIHPPTGAQKNSLMGLLKSLVKKHQILQGNILGHKEVYGARTLCPGKYFPLEEAKRIAAPEMWFKVQVGAFKNKENARKLKKNLEKNGYKAIIVTSER